MTKTDAVLAIGPAPLAKDGDTGVAGVERVVATVAATAIANEVYFGELDAVVGDGDFGYSLARGFEVVLEQWAGFDRSDAATFLKKIAVVVTSRIGGTSGPIWGTAFLRAGAAAAGVERLDRATAVSMLRSAVDGITARGQAVLGDKTLLDSLVPAIEAIESAGEADIAATLRAAARAARTSAEATSELQARRGRASYAGERSLGSVDAGAMAVAVIFEALADTWTRERADNEGWRDR